MGMANDVIYIVGGVLIDCLRILRLVFRYFAGS